MPTVRDILSSKGSTLHFTRPEATVLEATHQMNYHKLGALVVMSEGRIVGIFTERDLLRRVVAEQKDPAAVHVVDAMTEEVICVHPDQDLNEVAAVMQQKRVRHLPVCEEGDILGMVSIGDVNAMHASTQEQQITFLNEYIYGRV